MDNKDKLFKIHENFRLFITYNPFEVEQSKKLSSSFISKCLTYSLPPIDKDSKSASLILYGLFKYNKTFDGNEEIDEKEPLPKIVKEKLKEINTKEKKKKTKKTKKKNKKIKKKKNDSSSESSESESSEKEDDEEEDDADEEEDEDDKVKEDQQEKDKESNINYEEKMQENRINDVLKKNEKGIKLNKKQIRELSVKLANIHLYSKEFAKKDLQLFAGQKNFS